MSAGSSSQILRVNVPRGVVYRTVTRPWFNSGHAVRPAAVTTVAVVRVPSLRS
jgi:hypothetical protein